jgi:hypothetical protein
MTVIEDQAGQVQVATRVSRSVARQLYELAERNDRSVSREFRRALASHLQKELGNG